MCYFSNLKEKLKNAFNRFRSLVDFKADWKKINSIIKDILTLSFVQYIISFIISLYIRLVYKTSKIIVKGHTEEYLNSLQQNNSKIDWGDTCLIKREMS